MSWLWFVCEDLLLLEAASMCVGVHVGRCLPLLLCVYGCTVGWYASTVCSNAVL